MLAVVDDERQFDRKLEKKFRLARNIPSIKEISRFKALGDSGDSSKSCASAKSQASILEVRSPQRRPISEPI
jgi:hypothetical protein